MEDIEKRLKEIIGECLGVKESEIIASADISKDLGANSLDKVDLMVECERKFNIEFSDEQMDDVKTVSQLAEFLDKCLNKKKELVCSLN